MPAPHQPASPPRPARSASSLFELEPQADEALVDRIKWTTIARVALLTAVLVFAVVMDLGLGPQRPTSRPETLLYRLTAAFYLLSFFMLLATHLLRGSGHLRRLAVASVAIDVALGAALVAVTDGLQSLFLFAFPLAVLNAALLLHRLGALVAASLASLALLVMAGMELGWLPWRLVDLRVNYLQALAPRAPMPAVELAVQLLVQVAAVYGTALLSSHLVRELDRTRRSVQAERRELASLRVRYEDVVSCLPDGLLTVSPAGFVSSVNPAGCRILGLDEGEILARPLETVLPELGADAAFAETSRELDIIRIPAAADGSMTGHHAGAAVAMGPVTVEVRRQGPARGQQILTCRVATLRDPHGAAGRLVVFRDVTDTRAREEQHRNRERLAGIGTMAAAVAHEIRNPLASISGSIQLLGVSDGLSDTDKQLMAIVLRETDQLSNWIGEFLDFARPRPLQLATCDLGTIVAETLQACRQDPRIAAGGVELRAGRGLDVAQGEARPDCRLVGDAALLRQTVWNLLANAAQAVLVGERREVEVALQARGDTLELVIEDSGPGIAPEDIAHVFEPFYTTKGEGTGLGLATVKRHVMAHTGQVQVSRSRLGGARFVVVLPRRPGAGMAVESASPTRTRSKSLA